jgi:hypothetical protein
MEWQLKKGGTYESSKDCFFGKIGPKLPYFEGKKV